MFFPVTFSRGTMGIQKMSKYDSNKKKFCVALVNTPNLYAIWVKFLIYNYKIEDDSRRSYDYKNTADLWGTNYTLIPRKQVGARKWRGHLANPRKSFLANGNISQFPHKSFIANGKISRFPRKSFLINHTQFAKEINRSKNLANCNTSFFS